MPNQKVTAGAMAGAATTILVWVVQQVAHLTVPGEVAAALTTLLSFVTAYLVPNGGDK